MNMPSAKTGPPSSTRNSATAIAGIAVRTRAVSSERGLRRRRRAAASARARPRSLRAASVEGAGRRLRRAPAGVWGPLAIEPSAATEATSTGRVLGQALLERLAGEVGPELLAEDQLRVG